MFLFLGFSPMFFFIPPKQIVSYTIFLVDAVLLIFSMVAFSISCLKQFLSTIFFCNTILFKYLFVIIFLPRFHPNYSNHQFNDAVKKFLCLNLFLSFVLNVHIILAVSSTSHLWFFLYSYWNLRFCLQNIYFQAQHKFSSRSFFYIV